MTDVTFNATECAKPEPHRLQHCSGLTTQLVCDNVTEVEEVPARYIVQEVQTLMLQCSVFKSMLKLFWFKVQCWNHELRVNFQKV